MGRLAPRIVPGSWESVATAIAALDTRLNSGAAPTFSSISLTGLASSRLAGTSAAGALASITDLTTYIAGTVDEIDVADDGDGTITLSLAAGVSGAVDHNATLNTHNLTTDIDHDALTNFVANEHIDWTGATQDLLTSGFGTINGLVPGVDNSYDLGGQEEVGGGGSELLISQPTYGGLSEQITSASWRGNSFTPDETFIVNKITLRMTKNSSPENCTLALYATSGGVPTGVALDSATVDVSGITADSAGELVDFDLTGAVELTSGTMYAWVAYMSTGSVKLVGSSSNVYAGGTHVWSNNTGGSWGTTAGWDHVFYIYKSASSTEYARWKNLYLSGLLHDGVRALSISNLQDAYDHIHNLTTDIDHDALTNFSADEHFVQTAITNVSSALSTGLLKVTTGTGALSVVTDNSGNWNTAYGWGNHASAGYAISGGAEHDGFSDYVANEHIDWTNAAVAFVTSSSIQTTGGNIILPSVTGSAVGVIVQNSLRYIHNYGSVTNFFAGSEAGNFTLTGINNVGVGRRALQSLTSGQGNMSIGGLLACTTGSFNMAVGSGALDSITTTSNNVAIGTSALTQCTGGNNTGIGTSSGGTVTGDNNVLIGYAAGNNSGAISGCVHLGYQAGRYNTTSNRLYIENSNAATPLIYGEFDNDYVKINGDFEVTGSVVTLGSLPIADPGVAGQLWNSSGTVMVSLGP